MPVRDFLKRLSARVRCMPRAPGDQTVVPHQPVASSSVLVDARGTPTYDADFLTVWHKNTDFLQDQKFMAAYKAGMDSGHKIARPAGSSDDIHIEWRIHICCWAAWHAKQLPGDFVECGTNTGIMSLAVANYINFNHTGKRFFLFDTFDGIPEEQITPYERLLGRAQENEQLYEDCYERAKMNFSPFPRAILVRGKVPDTLATVQIGSVCYLCLDMNIVVPERAAIEHFWDKLVPGAPVILDDYGWLNFGKQKEAMDAFAAQKGVKIANLPTGQGLLFKP